jgi:hypothetical protein
MIVVYGVALAVPHGCNHKTTNNIEGKRYKAMPSALKA